MAARKMSRLPVQSFSISLMLFAVALAFPASRSEAEIYNWIDADGVVHFQDSPPAGEETTGTVQILDSAQTPSPDEPAAVLTANEPEPLSEPDPAGSEQEALPPLIVELYTTDWCPQCEKARTYFRSRSIAFTEYDIEKDWKAARRRKRLFRAPGVPLALVNGETILGFAPSRYERALSRR
jgi:glutaredoxin